LRGDYQLSAFQSLYELIYANLLNNGACQSLEGKVFYRGSKVDAYSEIWRGEMKTQDVEFDLINESLTTQILDNSWSAKFNNSQEQKVFLRSVESKNSFPIKQCDYNLCQFYDPTIQTPASYTYANRVCFRIYDVFVFLINYYTDGTVTFTSDFFNIGGDGDQYYITSGQELREGNNWVNPEVSFKEVFEEMDKKLNLWIIIEGTVAAPVLRIEPWGYVFNDTKVLTIDDPESVKMGIDLTQLYTIINVGSEEKDYDPSDGADYPNVRFESWNDESYNTPGDCEFENNTLDLVSSWK
ncbi:unnamed protein product, partial [marine sediment metagenome]